MTYWASITILVVITLRDQIETLSITEIDLLEISTDGTGIVRIYSRDFVLPLCGQNVSLREGSVFCRQMGKGLAKSLRKVPCPASVREVIIVQDAKCFGHEGSISDCIKRLHVSPVGKCPDSLVLALRCVGALANLVPDINSVERSVYVQLEPLYQLACAIEEHCLSPAAISKYGRMNQTELYRINDTTEQWRKLLRFSTIIRNSGEAVFEPHRDSTDWEWHSCHGHFHSMNTFAIYQIFALGTISVDDQRGLLLAGHKASFCLEDNVCVEGVTPLFRCSRVKTETGTQGISPGCMDTYLHNIDCQWIDVSDLPYGRYIFRLVVNPDILVAESNYHDNGIACELYYFSYYVGLHYCHFVHPLTMW